MSDEFKVLADEMAAIIRDKIEILAALRVAYQKQSRELADTKKQLKELQNKLKGSETDGRKSQ
ncbi:MAG: hypothetical protein M3Z48_11650 [Lactobacillus sp.]|nr:hypothetical protein [Lactobacillus melliventris]MBC6350447.1 hypothetical protein [Lactobacillus melliventris]MCT6888872.1 hypothetical protein [Lactobacillus sp.]MCT6903887.1 hypothetical protein [Lactobacillus sp.]